LRQSLARIGYKSRKKEFIRVVHGFKSFFSRTACDQFGCVLYPNPVERNRPAPPAAEMR
jgi:hypothetical protein